MLEPVPSPLITNPLASRAIDHGAVERDPLAVEESSRTSGQPRNNESKSTNSTSSPKDTVQISEEAQEIVELSARDREVRTHEAAHAAAGGRYAGSPSLTYEKGPDGRSYATGGEVSIDVSPVSGDSQATLEKAEIIRAAALAPAQPSAQDIKIASRASAMAAEARSELANQSKEELGSISQRSDETTPEEENTESELHGREREQNLEKTARSTFLRSIA